MDTLDLMIEINKRQLNLGLDISIHPKGFGVVYFGEGDTFFPVTVKGIKPALEDKLTELNSRGILYKHFKL